jgi:hypothetical protein
MSTDATPREESFRTERRIDGPIQELNRFGQPTDHDYYRCRACGREAMRRRDLADCCTAAMEGE